MSEYEFISLLREHVSFMMSTLQWWVGITLGVLIAVHVIGKDLNGYIASLLIALYAGFTVMVSLLQARHAERIDRIVADLDKLQEQGQVMSETSRLILGGGGPSLWTIALGTICYWGFFLSTIAYVIYCYRRAKQVE